MSLDTEYSGKYIRRKAGSHGLNPAVDIFLRRDIIAKKFERTSDQTEGGKQGKERTELQGGLGYSAVLLGPLVGSVIWALLGRRALLGYLGGV